MSLFKTITNTITLVITLAILTYTHLHAFKWGQKSVDNPIHRFFAGMKSMNTDTSFTNCNSEKHEKRALENDQDSPFYEKLRKQYEQIGEYLERK